MQIVSVTLKVQWFYINSKFLIINESPDQHNTMDIENFIFSSPVHRLRSNLQLSYYESVVEQALRLRMLHNLQPLLYDCEEIIKLDRIVSKGNNLLSSHQMAIYLNKLAPKSTLRVPVNKDLISRQRSLLMANNAYKYFTMPAINSVKSFNEMVLEQTRTTLDGMNIDLRKRWTKLYDRNPLFKLHIQETLSAEISNKSIQLRNVLSSKEPARCWNAECFRRKRERVHRILIYHRCEMELQNAEQCFPLIWNKPGSTSEVIDEVSGEALCHITLLCRDVICETNKCTTGCPTAKFSCDACKMKGINNSSEHQICGSYAEDCMLPVIYVKNCPNDAIKKWGDVDYMFHIGLYAGFEETESDIFATIEMDKSPPGYLQLRRIATGKLFRWPEITNLIPQFRPSTYMKHFLNSPHGPATEIRHTFASMNSLDAVHYISCSSWPSIAKPWIDRKRDCNWPSTETIQTIVSKGCRIVNKPHVLSKKRHTEFRFSFSEAEHILFGTLTSDQKKCFIAFKALLKYNIYKLENVEGEIKLNTYCLKTIFLWVCETFPAYIWQHRNGWSKCLLYLIDVLYICLKIRNIPGYFIPEINLIDSMKLSRVLLDEIEKIEKQSIVICCHMYWCNQMFPWLLFKDISVWRSTYFVQFCSKSNCKCVGWSTNILA